MTARTARGDRVTLWSVGWDGLDSARSAAMAVGTARSDGTALEVLLTNGPAVSRLDEASTGALRAMLRNGVPVIAAGGEAAVAAALGLPVSDQTAPTPGELYAVRMVRGRLARAYFVAVSPRPELLASVAPSETALTAGAQDALLRDALAWAARGQSRLTAEPSAPAQAAGAGAWNAVASQEWEWVGTGLDNTTAANILTLSVVGHKIQDLRADRDWYLADVRVSHQANADGKCSVSHPYCTHGEVGWYVQSRSLRIDRNGAQANAYRLEEYGPTGTIGSGSVSISVGGSLSSSDIGVSAGFSKTYNQQDVTIYDSSSPYDEYAKWDEDFTCPHGDYSLYPFHDDPADASKGTFFSDRAVIFQTTDLGGGVNLKFTPRLDAYYDVLDWPWYEFCLGVDVSRISYENGLGAARTMSIVFNNPPDKPALPSMKTPVKPNEAVETTVTGTDLDGDPLSFSFDFGDGTVSPFGAATQTHTWTVAGTYGVRVKAQDSPHGAISDWSTTFTVEVRAPGGGGGGCGTSGTASDVIWLLTLIPLLAARRHIGPGPVDGTRKR